MWAKNKRELIRVSLMSSTRDSGERVGVRENLWSPTYDDIFFCLICFFLIIIARARSKRKKSELEDIGFIDIPIISFIQTNLLVYTITLIRLFDPYYSILSYEEVVSLGWQTFLPYPLTFRIIQVMGLLSLFFLLVDLYFAFKKNLVPFLYHFIIYSTIMYMLALRAGAEARALIKIGYFLLIYFSLGSPSFIITSLLAAKQQREHKRNSKFFDAVKGGDIAKVRELLEKGASVNARDESKKNSIAHSRC
jgi:hypothetical protein